MIPITTINHITDNIIKYDCVFKTVPVDKGNENSRRKKFDTPIIQHCLLKEMKVIYILIVFILYL